MTSPGLLSTYRADTVIFTLQPQYSVIAAKDRSRRLSTKTWDLEQVRKCKDEQLIQLLNYVGSLKAAIELEYWHQ